MSSDERRGHVGSEAWRASGLGLKLQSLMAFVTEAGIARSRILW